MENFMLKKLYLLEFSNRYCVKIYTTFRTVKTPTYQLINLKTTMHLANISFNMFQSHDLQSTVAPVCASQSDRQCPACSTTQRPSLRSPADWWRQCAIRAAQRCVPLCRKASITDPQPLWTPRTEASGTYHLSSPHIFYRRQLLRAKRCFP